MSKISRVCIKDLFEKRTEKDVDFFYNNFSKTIFVQLLLHIIVILVIFATKKQEIDGIGTFVFCSHITLFAAYLILLWIGIAMKRRKKLILYFGCGSIVILWTCFALIAEFIKEAGQKKNINKYSDFVESGTLEKLRNLFTTNLDSTKALTVIFPLFLICHTLMLSVTYSMIEDDIVIVNVEEGIAPAQGQASSSNIPLQSFRESHQRNLVYINKPAMKGQSHRYPYTEDFTKASRTPKLGRISEAPSLESIVSVYPQIEIEKPESSQINESRNINENLTSEKENGNSESIGPRKRNICDSPELERDSEDNFHDFTIETEDSAVSSTDDEYVNEEDSQQKVFESIDSSMKKTSLIQDTETRGSKSQPTGMLIHDSQISTAQEMELNEGASSSKEVSEDDKDLKNIEKHEK